VNQSPIKVVQIIARMNVGGPAVIVADLMRGLDSHEISQTLITGYCDSNEADYLETVATDVKATRIAGLGRSVSPLADLRAFISLISMIRSIKPDVIHTHTAKAGVLGRLAAILSGSRAKRIHTFHGHLLHGYFTGWKTKLVIVIEKFFAAHTDVLVAVGNQVKNDLLAAGIGKTHQYHVIFPGLPAPHTSSKDILRKKFEMDATKIYVTFVGRLTHIKRPDRLMDIAALCKGSDIQFLIAGEGDLCDITKEHAAKEDLPVTFLGWRSDIEDLFAASDIALLCSDNEGIPLTLIQAAQAGLPIVATNVGSISDIVIHNESGYLTHTSAEALAQAIRTLADDLQLRTRFGGVGKTHSEAHFSLQKSLSDHTDLYKISHN
jgi:glycosyltransferase involved in cell wall biosynthesis